MPKGRLSLFFLLCVGSAAAQHYDDGYYPFASYEEPRPLLQPDSALFYRAVQSAPDLYDENMRFTLPQVAAKRRGRAFHEEIATVDGAQVPYRVFHALRTLGASESSKDARAGQAESSVGVRSISRRECPCSLTALPSPFRGGITS